MHISKNHVPFKILLVEDSLINQKIICRKLKALDFVVDIASTGLEAIELFKKNSYSVILMDIFMPGIDGLETTKKIREISEASNRPIILAISSNSESTDNKKYLEGGLDGTLDKNFELEDLWQFMPNTDLITKIEKKSSLDLSQIIEFSQGDDTFIIDLLETFLKDAEKNFEQLKTYQKEGKLQELKFITHKMKSAFRFIGDSKLGDYGDKIESYALDPKSKGLIDSIIPEMEEEFLIFIKELKKELINLRNK